MIGDTRSIEELREDKVGMSKIERVAILIDETEKPPTTTVNGKPAYTARQIASEASNHWGLCARGVSRLCEQHPDIEKHYQENNNPCCYYLTA